jgi:hypothetical protein
MKRIRVTYLTIEDIGKFENGCPEEIADDDCCDDPWSDCMFMLPMCVLSHTCCEDEFEKGSCPCDNLQR